MLNSPIFSNSVYPADMGGDTAQYGDAFMRAQFGKIGSGYHVRLANDAVLPTQTLVVPKEKGVAYNRPVGAHDGFDTIAGVAQEAWFSNQLTELMNKLANKGFVEKAPPEIVQAEQEKLDGYRREREALT